MGDQVLSRSSIQNQDIGGVIAQTAATTGTTSATHTNAACKGVKVVVNIGTLTGTSPTLTVQIQGQDPASGTWYTLLTSAALAAAGTTVLTVYPGVATTANVAASDVLPRTWRVNVVGGGTITNATYTVGATLLV